MPRIPLVWPYNPRSADLAKSPRRVNVMLEKAGERIFVQRRPGIGTYQSYTAGAGQGLTFFNGGVYSVIGDTLNSTAVANSGSSGATWTQLPDAMWAPREAFSIINLNGTIFLLGGFDAVNSYSDVWQLKPGGGWLQCTAAAPWGFRSAFSTGVIGNKMFVFGGVDDTAMVSGALHDVWSSIDGITWTQETIDAGWSARFAAGAISADNGIYIMGGEDASGKLNDIWFTTDGIAWKLVVAAADWSARSSLMTYYFANKLWVAGGLFGVTAKNDVWFSSDVGKTWTEATAAAWDTGRYNGGALVYNNQMWLINGYTGMAPSNKVFSSFDGNIWTLVTTDGPWNASSSGGVFVAPAPAGVSTYDYSTMWWVGGFDNSAVSAVQFYGALDTAIALSNALATSPANQPMQFASFNNGDVLLVKNQTNLWAVNAGSVYKITDDRYPVTTVPGIVVLGGFAYVMDPTGRIRNCNLNDPYHWPLLNIVGADYEDDAGVALVKYLNYVVAFGTFTIQFFYDAGNPVGSPLQAYLSGNMEIGCADANSIVAIGPTVAWVSRTREFWRQVMVFNGLTPKVISTPAIEKIIANWPTINGYSAFSASHMFYVIWTPNQPAMAYDFANGEWTEWSDTISVDRPLAMTASTSTLDIAGNLVLHPSNGTIYGIDISLNDDDGTPFPVLLVTDKVDNQNNQNKLWGDICVIGDMNPGTPALSWSDDDFQNFSTPRTVNMAEQRPILYRNGESRRRIFKYLQTDSNPLRVEALEQNFEQAG